jgi:hypothetical protein
VFPYVTAQELPPPSRTVFKCRHDGKIVYSDSPCLGAEKIDVEPTRGVSVSGKPKTGPDVQREIQREGFANAIKPLTGMDAKQFDAFGRRLQLSANAQRQCSELDKGIPMLEQEEARTPAADIANVQQRLFVARKRYRELRC